VELWEDGSAAERSWRIVEGWIDSSKKWASLEEKGRVTLGIAGFRTAGVDIFLGGCVV